MDGGDFLGILGWLALVVVGVFAIVSFARAGASQRRLDALEYHVRYLQAQIAAGQPATSPAPATPPPMPGAVPAGFAPPPVAPPSVPAPGQAWVPPPPPPAYVPPSAPPLVPASVPPPAPPLVPGVVPAGAPAAAGDGWSRAALEQKLGGGLFVWLGGIALALAALFLVRYAIDRGILSPTVRVILAALFGGALIGLSEWLRPRDSRVAQALAAAGVASLFGALFASVALYELIPRFVGGVLAMALTALAIGLALRHGPFVAALGFVGGVVSPLFLGSTTPNVPLLFGYLLAISVGTMAVIRHRGWWWLGWGVLAGDALWSLWWLVMREFDRAKYADSLIWVGLFQVAVAGLFVWATWRRVREEGDAPGHVVAKVWVATLVTGLLLVVGIGGAQTEWAGWVSLALHAAGIYALARYVPRFQWLAVAPLVFSLLAFLVWSVDVTNTGRFATTIAVMGGLLAVGAYALMWNAGRPGFWAALSTAAAFLHLALAYAALRRSLPDTSWGGISLGLAVPYLVAAERLARWRQHMAGATEALGFAAVGVVLFVAAAIPLELERQWTTMAYAFALPLVAWIAWKLDLRILRALCWLLVGIVSVRLVVNPSVVDYPVGSFPVVNWILYTYGLSAGAFWLGNWFLKLHADDALTVVVDAAATLFLFLLVTLEIHSLFQPDPLARERMDFPERATYIGAWGIFALLALAHDSQSPSKVGVWTWRIVGGLALTGAVLIQSLVMNPVFTGEDVGTTPIVNGLLLGFAVPALLAGAAAWWLARSADVVSRTIAGATAAFLLFVFVSAEVRHLFAPRFEGNPFDAKQAGVYLERATLIAAWGVFALLALICDSRWPSAVGLWTWRVVGGLALTCAILLQSLLMNPVFIGGDVGTMPIVNGLVLGFAVPALLAGAAASWLARPTDVVARTIARAGAVVLLFVFLSAEVRHLYDPKFEGNPFNAEGAELYLYSVVWLAFGVALLAIGMWRRVAAARHAGMAVVCLAICKVFLIDMSGLNELLRVFSFLGLGAVLLALAYFYRRLVFIDEPRAPVAGGLAAPDKPA